MRIRKRPGRAAAEGREPLAPMREDQLIWVFGYARSGSSWLSRMMTERPGYARWNEPQVGEMLGSFYYLRYPHRQRTATFLLAEEHRESWEQAVRLLVLGGAASRFPGAEKVVIKEPHGSIGAPLLGKALPASRMVLLLRDPRDMVASALDGQRRGSWASERRYRDEVHKPPTKADTNPDGFVRERADLILKHVSRAEEAYRLHSAPKALARYEDLRARPLETLERIFRDLSIPSDTEALRAAVEAHDWDSIPADDRGPGKIFRSATPGGWQSDLTPDQAQEVERIAEPILTAHYS